MARPREPSMRAAPFVGARHLATSAARRRAPISLDQKPRFCVEPGTRRKWRAHRGGRLHKCPTAPPRASYATRASLPRWPRSCPSSSCPHSSAARPCSNGSTRPTRATCHAADARRLPFALDVVDGRPRRGRAAHHLLPIPLPGRRVPPLPSTDGCAPCLVAAPAGRTRRAGQRAGAHAMTLVLDARQRPVGRARGP